MTDMSFLPQIQGFLQVLILIHISADFVLFNEAIRFLQLLNIKSNKKVWKKLVCDPSNSA